MYVSVCLPIHLFIYLSTHLSVYRSIDLSVCLSICLSVRASCLSICRRTPVHTHTLKHTPTHTIKHTPTHTLTHSHTHTHTHTHTHSNLQKGVRQGNRSRRRQSLSASRRKHPKRAPVRSHTRLADRERGHAAVLPDQCLFHPSPLTPAGGSSMPHLHAARRDSRHVAGKQKAARQCAGLSSRCQREGDSHQRARAPCLGQRDCCVVCCCKRRAYSRHAARLCRQHLCRHHQDLRALQHECLRERQQCLAAHTRTHTHIHTRACPRAR